MSDKNPTLLKPAKLDRPPIDHIVRTIVEKMNPRRVVLFGSYARGEAHDYSDVDIMVEMESDLRPPERAMAIDELFPGRRWAMDVLVFTPDEVVQWRDDVGTVLYTIEREGK